MMNETLRFPPHRRRNRESLEPRETVAPLVPEHTASRLFGTKSRLPVFARLAQAEQPQPPPAATAPATETCHKATPKTSINIPAGFAIADTGCSSILVMQHVEGKNKRPTKRPLTINYPDGGQVQTTHDLEIDLGLDSDVPAHTLPSLAHSSLVGIRVLCKMGCQVVFDDVECRVYYKNRLILVGTKDPITDLWLLPLNRQSYPQSEQPRELDLIMLRGQESNLKHVAHFAYSIRSKQNAVKYMHQSMCSPPHTTLRYAISEGRMKGAPHLESTRVLKYLPGAPATAKGHLRKRRKGLRTTTPKEKDTVKTPANTSPATSIQQPVHVIEPEPEEAAVVEQHEEDAEDLVNNVANVFCFGALADKNAGTFYNDLTGKFPTMSLDGNQAFFVMYHYESNSILAEPIADLDDQSIFDAYRRKFEYLESKGFKMKLNIMDNQATKQIKSFLTKKQCRLQLVEPHNHRVNAAERAIQTFKNHFISAIATTDEDFPLQLWDRLTPQVVDTLNILRPSRVDPSKSAYEVLEGPYDWNRYPLAPPGCKAVIYEDPDARGSWAPRGIDAWYLGPSKDHYRCAIFYVPETRAYRISGTAEFYPQHCQVPSFTPSAHVKELQQELAETMRKLEPATRRKLFTRLTTALAPLLTRQVQRVGATPAQAEPEQRVTPAVQRVEQHAIQRVSVAPRVTTSATHTTKRKLRTKKRTHRRQTRNNTPGAVPLIEPSIRTRHPLIEPPATHHDVTYASHVPKAAPRRSPRHQAAQANTPPSTSPPPPPTPRRERARSNMQRSAAIISQEAVNLVTARVFDDESDIFTPNALMSTDVDLDKQAVPHLELFCAPVVHPETGETITKYKALIKDPLLREIWMTAFGKEFGNLAQGDAKTGTKGTNAVFVMSHEEIKNIPKDRTVTYGRIVVDFRPQKEDPNRVRITAGGNLISYPGELTTRTADLTTSKVLWNSVLSTENAKYMCVDISSFYLTAPMDRYEYMRMPLDVFPPWTIEQYGLNEKAKNGFVYLEIRRSVYGLPQSGALANKLLRERLAPHGYFECRHTPGLWKHVTRPVQFSLVVDDFGVKYVGKEHANHLVSTLKKYYKISEDWTGSLYCGIDLKWDYDARTLDISMPGYIKKQLQKYKHITKKRAQHCPFNPQPKQYGSAAQDTIPPDESPRLDDEGNRQVPRIVGSILYYARAVDMTALMALSTLASEQATATENTMTAAEQLLDYLATHPDATIRYYASEMILNIHSDASYLSEKNAKSRVAGHFFLGSLPRDGEPIKLNGAIFTLCGILRFVVASAAEAELGALFQNCKEGKVIRLILEEMGHPQPPTPVHCDNKTATGIANNSVKRHRSRSMEMRFFWVSDQVDLGLFDVRWYPGLENLADYVSKHHSAAHHQAVRPWYLHTPESPTELPRALAPSTLRGCVGTLPKGYIRSAPLPKVRCQTAVAAPAIATYRAYLRDMPNSYVAIAA